MFDMLGGNVIYRQYVVQLRSDLRRLELAIFAGGKPLNAQTLSQPKGPRP